MPVRLREGLRVEELDGEAIVLDRKGASVHRFTGDAVEALRLLGGDLDPSDVPEHLVPAFDELVASGVVANPALWTRRKMLLAGGAAAWGAATISSFALSLPASAAGLSMCPDGQLSTGPTQFTVGGTYNTGPAELSVLVRAWGGGGGGAGPRSLLNSATGGGGGGGQYTAHPSLTVTPCSMYSVVVGTGGTGGAAVTVGQAGGTSSFGGAATFSANGGGGGPVGGGMFAAGGSGGTVPAGGSTNAGGNGGQGLNGRGGGGGGSAGNGGPGGTGANGPGSGQAVGGTAGPGTPPGGAGGNGGGGALGPGAFAGMAPGGGGGGGGTGTASASGAAGAVWVGV